MDEKIFERMLDNLIDEAKPEIIERLNNCTPEDAPEVEFSEEHKKAMEKIFEQARMLERKPKQAIVYKRVASVLGAVIIVSGIAISSVAALKNENFAKFFLNKQEDYSEVGTNVEINNDWQIENVYFGYVPEEYKIINSDISERSISILFSSGKSYFTLSSSINNIDNKINTESGDCTEVTVNNKKMIYSVRDDLKILTWVENDLLNTLYTNDKKDILIDIAEKIQFIN